MITDDYISVSHTPESAANLSLQDVEVIVNQFYVTPNIGSQAAYEKLLISDEAWILCAGMLSPTSPMSVQFFGANVLYCRISRLFYKLKPAELYSLRVNLINFISVFAKSGPRNVYVRLCVSLIQLALRMMPDKWPNPLEDLTKIFQELLPKDKARATILTLLKIFPEELETLVDNELRQQISSELPSLANFVFKYIEFDLTQDVSEMKCISSWARLGVDMLLFSPKILDTVFTALCAEENEELSESACDTLVELFSSPNGHNFKLFWINQILPRLIGLSHSFTTSAQKDKYDMSHLTRLSKVLINFAENHANVLFYEESRLSLFPFMSLLLACTSFPGQYPTEETISDLTLSSWYAIQDELLHTETNVIECLEEMKSFYRSLVKCLVVKCCLPQSELSAEDNECFRCYRINCSDTLNYVFNVLHSECFDILLQCLKNAGEWRKQESVLFLLGSLAEQEDIKRKHMDEIFELLPAISFDSSNKLILTGLLFVGQLSESLKFFPEYIFFAIEFCIKCLKNPCFISYATLSLKSIARESREFIVKYTDIIVTNCFEIVAGQQYPMNERLKCMCVIGYTLSFVHPRNSMIAYFDTVITPYVQKILENLRETPGNEESEVSLTNNLLFLNNFITSFTAPVCEESQHLIDILNDSCLLLLKALMPVFSSVVSTRSSSNLSVVECIFEIISHFVSLLQTDFAVFLTDIKTIIDSMNTSSVPKHMLNVIRQCCMIFDLKDEQFHQCEIVKYLLINACQRFLCSVNASVSLNDLDVELIEEFMLFSHQLLRQKVYLFDYLNDEIIRLILKTSISALQLQEVVLIRSAAACLVGFINYPRLRHIFLSEGGEIIKIVVCAISLYTPRFSVELLVTPLLAFSYHFPEMFNGWLKGALSCSDLNHVSLKEKEKFLSVFTTERNKTRLRQAAASFALVCRGLSGTDYAKQTSRYF